MPRDSTVVLAPYRSRPRQDQPIGYSTPGSKGGVDVLDLYCSERQPHTLAPPAPGTWLRGGFFATTRFHPLLARITGLYSWKGPARYCLGPWQLKPWPAGWPRRRSATNMSLHSPQVSKIILVGCQLFCLLIIKTNPVNGPLVSRQSPYPWSQCVAVINIMFLQYTYYLSTMLLTITWLLYHIL